MAVRIPKQSARLAATLNSPPLTWIWHSVALRKGMTPGSRRWTNAPSETRSNAPVLGIFNAGCIMENLTIAKEISEDWPRDQVHPESGSRHVYFQRARPRYRRRFRTVGAVALNRQARLLDA